VAKENQENYHIHKNEGREKSCVKLRGWMGRSRQNEKVQENTQELIFLLAGGRSPEKFCEKEARNGKSNWAGGFS